MLHLLCFFSTLASKMLTKSLHNILDLKVEFIYTKKTKPNQPQNRMKTMRTQKQQCKTKKNVIIIRSAEKMACRTNVPTVVGHERPNPSYPLTSPSVVPLNTGELAFD